ncbi:MAG: acyltransferase, partial [Bacilli bacterium]|nr:acyltransferase [Bacilli bacterium]
MSNEKNKNIIITRAIATLLVIFAHSTRIYTPVGAIPGISYNSALNIITNFIYMFHMPLFFVISGYVFCLCVKNNKYSNKIDFVKNKFNRLIIPYLFFGLLYVAPVMCLLKLSDLNYVDYVIKNILLLQDSRHLWFLPVLFAIFVIESIIGVRTSKKRKVFLVLLLVAQPFMNLITINLFANIIKYGLFFEVGVVLAEMNMSKNKCLIIGLLLVIVFVVCFFLNYTNIFIQIVATLGVFLIINSLTNTSLSESWIIKIIDKYSMGIYLFHPMIIYMFYSIPIIKSFNPYINILLSSTTALL